MDLADKKLFCRIIGQLIVADGEVTDAEHDFLEKVMTRFGLSEAEREQLVDGISTTLEIDEAAAKLSEDAKSQLINDLIAAATSDGVLAGSEAKVIQSVKDALGRE